MSTRSFMAGERPSKKPVIPLRYRIDPTAKKLDDLDSLELELQRTRSQYDSDTYDTLLSSIETQREAIHKKIDKGKPEVLSRVGSWDGPRVNPTVKQRMSNRRIIWAIFLCWFLYKIITNSA